MVCRRGGGTLVASRHSSNSWSTQGGEFQVNSYTTGNQRYSAVASDAIGNFVVVWVREGQGRFPVGEPGLGDRPTGE